MRIPAATYRLQFTTEFGFDEASALIPYLEALGITDLYASPLFQARDGSEHGYDVTDPRRLDTGVGGRSSFEMFTADLQQRGMGLLLDIVPNHMAASSENTWWRDVLRWGPYSVHAAKFDIDWEGGQEGETEAGRLVLPLLGAPLPEVLEAGDLKLVLGSDGFQLHYHEHHLPLCPVSFQLILAAYADAEDNNPHHYTSPLHLLTNLTTAENGNKSAAAMSRAVQAGKKMRALYETDSQVQAFIHRVLEFWNNGPGREQLAALLAEQHYRLVYWREGQHQGNYRRFFDINSLVSLRIEDEAVFQAVHARVLELARAGAVTGLRIDHVDGLYDPEGYLKHLQEQLTTAGQPDADNNTTFFCSSLPFYILVEKILEAGEELPTAWPVAGTTGYDFMNMLTRHAVDARGLAVLDEYYKHLSADSRESFEHLVYLQKRKVMHELFSGEMAGLSLQLAQLAARDGQGQQLSHFDLEAALAGVTAAFPVYRTYIRDFAVTPRDRNYIDEALLAAAAYGDSTDEARAFLGRLLRLELAAELPQKDRAAHLRFVMRWQQFTGPIMAKGFEDTILYLYNRLLSFNEVGADPSAGGLTPTTFHQQVKERLAASPHTMNATSTHDTKRSEDVRARINVLSEIPQLWLERLGKWQQWNAPQQPQANGKPVPEHNFELLLYQTLIGAWPLHAAAEEEFHGRLEQYLVKASREAKAATSWLDPNEEYENALCTFARRILADNPSNHFREDLLRLVKLVSYYGALNSLAQVVLKIACPGVPDFYMGTELWDFSLVDPDNRRPVDFERCRSLLADLQKQETDPELARELLNEWDGDRLKLYVTWKALQLRRTCAALFTHGTTLPLETKGPQAEYACALLRDDGKNRVLAAVPRLPLLLSTGGKNPATVPDTTSPPLGRHTWTDTVLLLPDGAPQRWQNVFTGESISAAAEQNGQSALALAQVMQTFPVALLTATV